MAIKIRKLKYKEIELLRDFPPADWHFNIVSFMKLHFGEDYFIPFVAEHSGEIVGVGNGIYTGDTGWLGNIIVKNDHRGKGVGTAVTNHLIVALKKWNCKSLLLIATRQGEPIYRKLGFNTTQYYHFFRCGLPLPSPDTKYLRPLSDKYLPVIFEIDKYVTGEDRQALLVKFITNGWIYRNNKITGFFLPDFDQGYIAALNNEAGLTLLQLKISLGMQSVVIPEENKSALEYLSQMGYKSYAVAPRMLLGEAVSWEPELIFSRAAGYCG